MSKGKEAGGRPRTVYAATNEEEVEEFVLKGWPAGYASPPATGFRALTVVRHFTNLSLQSSLKPKRSLTTNYLSWLEFSEATISVHGNQVCWRKSGIKVLWSFTNWNEIGEMPILKVFAISLWNQKFSSEWYEAFMLNSELNVLSMDKISDSYLIPIGIVGQETLPLFIGIHSYTPRYTPSIHSFFAYVSLKKYQAVHVFFLSCVASQDKNTRVGLNGHSSSQWLSSELKKPSSNLHRLNLYNVTFMSGIAVNSQCLIQSL